MINPTDIFKAGDIVTTIAISDYLAHTVRTEWKVKGYQNGRYFGTLPGKRKEFYIPDMKHDVLHFKGNIPFRVDSDTGSFFGNGMINFVTDEPEELKSYILDNNVNPNFSYHNHIMWTTAGGSDGEYNNLFTSEVEIPGI